MNGVYEDIEEGQELLDELDDRQAADEQWELYCDTYNIEY